MSDLTLDDITYGTAGWNGLAQSNFEAIEDYINSKTNFLTKIASVSINAQTTTKQTIYTVPASKVMVPVFIIVREPSATLAGLVDADFGAGANADDWILQVSLNAFTAVTDYGLIKQVDQAAGPPIVPVKKTINIAADVWGIKINTGSTGAATVTIDLFGYLDDA